MPTATIPVPKITFGKRKTRSLMVEEFTDDGQIVNRELSVLRGCADDATNNCAYVIDTENQFSGEDNQWYQILGERSCIPICLRNKSKITDITKLINEIHAASYRATIRQQFIDALKDSWQEKILWIVTIPCVTLLLFYALKMLGD